MLTKKWPTLLGGIILVSALYFIGLQLVQHKAVLLSWRPDAQVLGLLGLAIVIYTAANFWLALGWIGLLQMAGAVISHKQSFISCYGKSQIGKYIPGNVLHIASRHVLGHALGVQHASLAIAAVYELAGLLTAALFISLLGLPFLAVSAHLVGWLSYLAPLMVLLFFCVPHLHRLVGKNQTLVLNAWHLFWPLMSYLGFFCLAGLALLLLLCHYSTTISLQLVITGLTAFAVAWAAGFITPGAPSGLGVREGLLIFLLTPLVSAELAIIVAFLLRVVTVAGDLLFWLCSVRRRPSLENLEKSGVLTARTDNF